MGLSVTATCGIIFTASLLLFGVLLNSLLYAYDNFQDGLSNKVELIGSQKNMINIDRIVYNQSEIEIIALNNGPKTLDNSKLSILVNGTPVNFSSTQYWYPGAQITFFINSTYSIGSTHNIQFSVPVDSIASSENDKIYVLNNSEIFAYYYSGTLAWERKIDGPWDLSSSSSVYVLNSTGILEIGKDGQVERFLSVTNLTSLDSRGPYIYAINSTKFVVMNTTGVIIKKENLTNGEDVAVGKYVYVLDNGEVKVFDYSGNYLRTISDSRLSLAVKIASDYHTNGDYLIALTNYGSLLVYSNGSYVGSMGSISLSKSYRNLDFYGKIYLSGSSLDAIDSGYRIKMVDEYGNEIYGFL